MSDLTIAQALRRIKKLKGELGQLKEQAKDGVSYQVNSEPAFEFSKVMEKITVVRNELLDLESRVAVANAITNLDYEGRSMSLALAVRTAQELKGTISFINELPVRNHEKTTETSRDYNDDMKLVNKTIEYRCALPKAKQVETVKALQEQFDRLNDAVETMNHRTVLKKI